MKTFSIIPIIMLFIVHLLPHRAFAFTDSLNFDNIYLDLQLELGNSQQQFYLKKIKLEAKLNGLDMALLKTAGKNKKKYIQALEEKIKLQTELWDSYKMNNTSQLKIRYRKGVEMIKLMYEKLLSLDHHFTGMQTYQNVSLLSNPNNFPDFQKSKEIIEKHDNKKYSMNLPALLETNPFISASYLLVSSFLGERSRESKQRDFNKVACILDFTVRMNADLNMIRYETEYLKQANLNLKVECEKMFEEYCKAVGYHVPLENCRANDDWETLFETVDKFVQEMEQQIMMNSNSGISKGQVNMEFATQRVSDFIGKYSNFIAEGLQYYMKFDNIISNYENEKNCIEQLPRQYTELKFDVKSTIEKFNNTYNLPELQGSRLKDLLYGASTNF